MLLKAVLATCDITGTLLKGSQDDIQYHTTIQGSTGSQGYISIQCSKSNQAYTTVHSSKAATSTLQMLANTVTARSGQPKNCYSSKRAA